MFYFTLSPINHPADCCIIIRNAKIKHSNSTKVNSNINTLTSSTQGASTTNLTVGPLSAFTPETIEVMDLASSQINEGKELRRKGKQAINEAMENAKLAGKTVEDYFVKKISETVTLSVRGEEKQAEKLN